MLFGYTGKILWVNLSKREVKIREADERLYKDYIGGYGVGVRILYDEMKGGVDPLGADNVLGFAIGPLTGYVPFGGRYTVFAKSPLTGGWGDANSGGSFGPAMKQSGFDVVLVKGISPNPVYLLLDDGKATLEDAREVWGKDCVDTDDYFLTKYGKKTEASCIGPSGENLSLIAAVVNKKGRAAGRSGIGAVMGSKRLKAVVAKGGRLPGVADGEALKQARKEGLSAFCGPYYDQFKTVGTSGATVDYLNAGNAPTKNWGGTAPVDFAAGIEKFDANTVIAKEARKYACALCPVACGGLMKKIEGEYELEAGAHKPEYETQVAFGSNCLIDNMDAIIVANDICNRYGIDTISAGATLAFAMECYEKGLISQNDTDGIELKWGNHKAMIAMLKKLARREGFGEVLADGVKKAAEKIGKEAKKYAMHVGGQEAPMLNPLVLESAFPTYQVDATPGRHTQALVGVEDTHIANVAGLCLFGHFVGNGPFVREYLTAVTGWDRFPEELGRIGARIHNLRHAFNLREGINAKDIEVPGRIVGKPPQAAGPLAEKSVDTEGILAAYVTDRGWDPSTFKPTRETLSALGLEDIAEDLWSKS